MLIALCYGDEAVGSLHGVTATATNLAERSFDLDYHRFCVETLQAIVLVYMGTSLTPPTTERWSTNISRQG